MDDKCFKHVLFKDLKLYLKRTDYLSGFTATEQAFIRQNIGALSQIELNMQLKNDVHKVTYDELVKLIDKSALNPGQMYLITDYQTIYSSTQLNSEGKLITWGLNIHPSEVYKVLTTAYSNTALLPQAFILDNNCIIEYDVNKEQLDDGVFTKGKIKYMLDSNRNQANFDFKNWKFIKDDNIYHLFSNTKGKDNSNNCYYNNCCLLTNTVFIGKIENTFIKGDNNFINSDITNLFGELSNCTINSDEIGLANNTNKYIINLNSKYYIDYLDLETLTHQFYEL